MKLVVGLGNPGPRYAATRHNIGFRIVERFGGQHRIGLEERRYGARFGVGCIAGIDIALLEPQTYMNRSGSCVREALEGLGRVDLGQDLLLVYDDVDLPFGRLRIRTSGGAGGHRGLADVIDRTGRRDLPRLRFGVGRPPPGFSTTEYVLEPFSADEEKALDERIAQAVEAVGAVVLRGVEFAMNRYNAVGSVEDSVR